MAQQGDHSQKPTEPFARTKIALFGYGEDARARALRRRGAGHDVVVCVRPGGMSWIRATRDGELDAPVDRDDHDVGAASVARRDVGLQS